MAGFTIRKIQLTPLQEGTLTLDKVYVDNVVQLLTEENLELTNFSVQVSNEPVTVEVKPLPVQGETGAVFRRCGRLQYKSKR